MSSGADRPPRVELPRQWERLERLAGEAAAVVGFWRRRAVEAEEEVGRLRRALDEVASLGQVPSGDLREEIRRVRAENASLQSRLLEARVRVQGLLKRLVSLGIDA